MKISGGAGRDGENGLGESLKFDGDVLVSQQEEANGFDIGCITEKTLLGDGRISRQLSFMLRQRCEGLLNEPFLSSILENERKFLTLAEVVNGFGIFSTNSTLCSGDPDLFVKKKLSFVKLEINRQSLEKLIEDFLQDLNNCLNQLQKVNKSDGLINKEKGHKAFFSRLALGHSKQLEVLLTELKLMIADLSKVVVGDAQICPFDSLKINNVFADILNIKNNLNVLRVLIRDAYALESVEVMDLSLNQLKISPYGLDDLRDLKGVLEDDQSRLEDVNSFDFEVMRDFIYAELFESDEKLRKEVQNAKYTAVITGVRENLVNVDFQPSLVAKDFSQAVAKIVESFPDDLIFARSLMIRAKMLIESGQFGEAERMIRMYKMFCYMRPNEISENGPDAFAEWQNIKTENKPAFLKKLAQRNKPKLSLVK